VLAKCPTCQTVFRITGKALRAARGYVRCGHCNLQFDAIHQLLDEDELETLVDQKSLHTLPVSGNLPKEKNPHSANKNEPFSYEEIVMEGDRIEISGLYRQLDADDDITTITGTFAAFEELNQAYSNWDLSPEDFEEKTEDSLHSIDERELEAHSLETPSFQALSVDNRADEVSTENKSSPSENGNTPLDTPALPELDSKGSTKIFNDAVTADETSKPTPTASVNTARYWPWTVASLVLILIVLAQGFHHYRQTLANHPLLGPQVHALYTALGKPLSAPVDIKRYTSTLTGMVSDLQLPGTLQLKAVITNQDTSSQPYPWISVRLENRFGNAVGGRTFKPEEYLGTAIKDQLMAAGISTSIALALVDPGQDAVGVKIDTCLPLSTGLRCTHDNQP
jgi:predicted Zn finger-like uncharacterized protein